MAPILSLYMTSFATPVYYKVSTLSGQYSLAFFFFVFIDVNGHEFSFSLVIPNYSEFFFAVVFAKLVKLMASYIKPYTPNMILAIPL